MTFGQMLRAVIKEIGMPQYEFACSIGYSPQYISDIIKAKRTPSVELTNKICDYLGRGPKGRQEWHRAGAKAHGWAI